MKDDILKLRNTYFCAMRIVQFFLQRNLKNLQSKLSLETKMQARNQLRNIYTYVHDY